LKFSRLFGLLLISFSTLASENETVTYLCVSEESTGFFFKDGKWEQANFDVSEDKFIIRPIKKSDGFYFKDKENPYGVFELGNKRPSKRCKDLGNIVCNVGIGELRFSPETGRFIKTYTAGYWDGIDGNEDTPNITRGRCSRV
jgi:hypothetical protein